MAEIQHPAGAGGRGSGVGAGGVNPLSLEPFLSRSSKTVEKEAK